MKNNVRIPKGMRDFSSEDVQKRCYIKNCIEKHFKLYGYLPLETTSIENSETLLGHYGEEGDKLIFRILNSGNFLSKIDDNLRLNKDFRQWVTKISNKSLRYDLTVPFARYVVQNRNDLIFPFKRYQIQTVWRADKPQKGRYREFCQCDADCVGSDSLWLDVEFIQLYRDVFRDLKLPVVIYVNNRKVLTGIAETIKIEEKFTQFVTLLDKIDKAGIDVVCVELEKLGISSIYVERLKCLINPTNNCSLYETAQFLNNSKIGMKGIEELKFIENNLNVENANWKFQPSLARGIQYYTGTIIEVKSNTVDIGSLGGGGRYDNLTEQFGLKNFPGIGISFGLDRIYYTLKKLNLFPEFNRNKKSILFLNFGFDEAKFALKYINILRKGGLVTELYPSSIKLGKQMQYADKKHFTYTVLLGSKEISNNTAVIKLMESGEQREVKLDDLYKFFNDF